HADPEEWVDAFADLAARQEDDATARAERGHHVSAHDGLLRACNSYRAAEYYCDSASPRHGQLGRKSRECFLDAMRKAGPDCDELFVPFGNIELPVYILRPPTPHPDPAATLVVINGFD